MRAGDSFLPKESASGLGRRERPGQQLPRSSALPGPHSPVRNWGEGGGWGHFLGARGWAPRPKQHGPPPPGWGLLVGPALRPRWEGTTTGHTQSETWTQTPRPPTLGTGPGAQEQNKLILNTGLQRAALPIINPWGQATRPVPFIRRTRRPASRQLPESSDHGACPPPSSAQPAASTGTCPPPRPTMPALPAARIWPFLLLLAVQLGAAVGAPQPWHCAPCSAERLALCPPLPASCPEPARPAGCGCCPVCALPLGAACGVATARCARGLSCRALPGEPQPLYALTRGQGACMPESDNAEATGTEVPPPGLPPGDG